MPRSSMHAFALALATIGSFACDRATSDPVPTAPRIYPEGSGFRTVGSGMPAVGPAVRGNVGAFKAHTYFNNFNVQLHAQDDADLVFVNVLGAPGGHSGWHYHPGPAFVLVKTGEVTSYSADDPTCTGTAYPAGTVLVEGTTSHILRNEGAVDAELMVLFLVPAGAAQRIDAPDPGTCPF